MQAYLPLVGRVLIALIFIMSGFNKIMNFEGTQIYMAAAGMPMTALFLAGAIVLELAGGVMVALGYKAKTGALLLMIFLIPTTLIFHNDLGNQMQMIMFMKNLSILGALILLYVHGSGAKSLKND